MKNIQSVLNSKSPLYVGDFTLTYSHLEQTRDFTVKGKLTWGNAVVYNVEGPNVIGQIVYVTWQNGESHVYARELSGASGLLHVNDRLRMIVEQSGRYDSTNNLVATLRFAHLDRSSASRRPSLRNISLHQLDAITGLDVKSELHKTGCKAIDTKQVIFRDQGRSRNQLCIVFAKSNVEVPVVAFLISRVISVFNQTFILHHT